MSKSGNQPAMSSFQDRSRASWQNSWAQIRTTDG